MSAQRQTIAIIMAGGLGKRMESDLPKVLHPVAGMPMLVRVIRSARAISPAPKKILIVVGQYKDIIEKTILEHMDLQNDIEFVLQPTPLGTGHAIQCCIPQLEKYPDSRVLVLSGDVPLLETRWMENLVNTDGNTTNQKYPPGTMNDGMKTEVTEIRGGVWKSFGFPMKVLEPVVPPTTSIMVTQFDDPTGYGRILENHEGTFQEIREEKDCSAQEKTVKKVNCGIYSFDSTLLLKYLPLLKNNNAQNEYYLTDVIGMIRMGELITVNMVEISKEEQVQICGVNTKAQLEELSQLWYEKNMIIL